jgi:ABC-2 type transport system ATP-binding protein
MVAIAVHHLTKRYGGVLAVDDLSFTVQAGTVTAFLGPNGAGKSTTLRALLGLVRPDAGTVTFDGHRYADLAHPTATVGAVLEDAGAHPSRTAANHLDVVAGAAGIDRGRVDTVLDAVGLSDVAGRRVGGFSLGMRRRLGIATALLGDPAVLVLDEPANGLDPAGVRWLRDLLRRLAAEDRAVLVSSHLLAEVAHGADRVVIVDRGRLVRAAAIAELSGPPTVSVRTPEGARLRQALTAAGIATHDGGDGTVVATGSTPEDVGRIVAAAGIVVYELRTVGASLEDAFLSLTSTPEVAP